MIHIETHISPDNVQGLSCLTIIVAIKSTPRAILDMILHISSPDIFIGTIADNSTLQLREFGELKHNYVINDSVLREMGISALIQRTDYLLPKFATPFGTKISSREQWVAFCFFLGIVLFQFSWMDQRLILAQILEHSMITCIFLVAQNMHSFKQKFINQQSM